MKLAMPQLVKSWALHHTARFTIPIVSKRGAMCKSESIDIENVKIY
jgi:hypothetical protein